MELSTLKTFLTIVREGGFSKASPKLYLTQPALSTQIKTLEKELGEPLFDRNSRKLTLTEAGKVLIAHAEQLFETIEIAKQDINALRNVVRGALSIGCSDTLSAYLLPSLISPFWRKAPDLDITVKNAPTAAIIELVLQKTVDIGIVTLPVEHPRLTTLPLITYSDIVVFSKTSPPFRCRSITLAELAAERLLLLESGTRHRKLLDAEFQAAGLVPASVMSFGSVAVQKAFAKTGIGVAVVPDFAAKEEIQRKELGYAAIQGIARRSAGIIMNSKKNPSPAAKALLAELKGYSGKS